MEVMSSPGTVSAQPLLRTLAPALRQLERDLRAWLDGPHPHPPSSTTRADLEILATDLRRQADALDVDRPILVVMLMGGTGVGKSTLLNALAGGSIAQASFARPTTRDPVVYYHESVRTERLDPELRHCRLVPHDRPALEQKILVDTPDLDSNDLSNREKLMRLLPVADVVLYVGSQEKYHDKLGWELFREQRRRHAFAFVLNKWDRCLHGATSGMRPDEDLLRDLNAEGFDKPVLFRTCGQYWVDRAARRDGDTAAPEGEQFRELTDWLELGLSRLEIDAIKARGVGQLLTRLQEALQTACPPDLGDVAGRTHAAWEKPLIEEAAATAEVLLNTLEPYQREVEHHFALQGQRRFRGMMAAYLHLFTRIKYIGSQLRERLPLGGPSTHEPTSPEAALDLATFTHACSDVAANNHLDARGRALANRLLVEADRQGFPIDLLSGPVESASHIDWRHRYALVLTEVLQEVEAHWARPTGFRRWLQIAIILIADWVPLAVLLGTCGLVLWRLIVEHVDFRLEELLMPVATVALTLFVLHILILLLLPLRWAKIRGEFQRRLEARVRKELEATYGPVPNDVVEALRAERKKVEELRKKAADLAAWMDEREQAAGSVAGLYGT